MLPRLIERASHQPSIVPDTALQNTQKKNSKNKSSSSSVGTSGDASRQVEFEEMALELLCRKVAAVNGDARRAIELSRLAIERALDARQRSLARPLSSTENQSPTSAINSLAMSTSARTPPRPRLAARGKKNVSFARGARLESDDAEEAEEEDAPDLSALSLSAAPPRRRAPSSRNLASAALHSYSKRSHLVDPPESRQQNLAAPADHNKPIRIGVKTVNELFEHTSFHNRLSLLRFVIPFSPHSCSTHTVLLNVRW